MFGEWWPCESLYCRWILIVFCWYAWYGASGFCSRHTVTIHSWHNYLHSTWWWELCSNKQTYTVWKALHANSQTLSCRSNAWQSPLLFRNSFIRRWAQFFSVHKPFIKQRLSFVILPILNHVKRLKAVKHRTWCINTIWRNSVATKYCCD